MEQAAATGVAIHLVGRAATDEDNQPISRQMTLPSPQPYIDDRRLTPGRGSGQSGIEWHQAR